MKGTKSEIGRDIYYSPVQVLAGLGIGDYIKLNGDDYDSWARAVKKAENKNVCKFAFKTLDKDEDWNILKFKITRIN